MMGQSDFGIGEARGSVGPFAEIWRTTNALNEIWRATIGTRSPCAEFGFEPSPYAKLSVSRPTTNIGPEIATSAWTPVLLR
jgi:hypothetical protein